MLNLREMSAAQGKAGIVKICVVWAGVSPRYLILYISMPEKTYTFKKIII